MRNRNQSQTCATFQQRHFGRRCCARKLHKSPTIIARWSKRHQWQQRLRELALEDCQRAVAADEQAKLDVARELERQRLKHTETKLRASAELFKKAFKVLQKSAKGSHPSDSTKMFIAGALLGDQALGVGGSVQTGAFGLRPTAPANIVIRVQRDEKGDEMDMKTIQFMREHPEHGQSRPGSWLRQMLDAAHGEGWSERMLNGECLRMEDANGTDQVEY